MPVPPSEVRLEFHPPALEAAAVPLAALLAIIWAGHYVLRGRRPAGGALRFLMVVAIIGMVAAIYRFTDILAGRPLVLVLLTLLILHGIKAAYAQTTHAVSGLARAAVAGLRMISAGLVLLLLARPVMKTTWTRTERPSVAVLLDASQSMRIRDVGPGGAETSRAQAVQTALQGHWRAFGKLRESFDIIAYAFDAKPARLGPVESRPWDVSPDGTLTDIGAALSSVIDASGSTPAGAVLLISDGADNGESEEAVVGAARSLGSLGIALFCAGVGSDQPRGDTRSIVAGDMRVPAQTSPGVMIPIEADFEVVGFQGIPIHCELLWDGLPAGKTDIRPSDSRETIHPRFERLADPVGFHTVEIRARPQDVAWRSGPASVSRYVRVVDDLIQVLYVEASPRTEGAFVARALAAEKRLRLTKVLLARPVEGPWVNPLPRAASDWQRYHAILLGDLERRDLTSAQIDGLSSAVSDFGSGLAIIGGFDRSGSKGFADTSLADVSPVEWGSGKFIESAVNLELTPTGKEHVLCRVGPAARPLEPWTRMPPLVGMTLLGSPKPASEVLVTDTSGNPALVVATVGKGRSLALAADSTWRWAMRMDDGIALHERFWRQAVYWLANQRPNIHISVERPRYDLVEVRPGSAGIEVQAFAMDGRTGLPLQDVRLNVVLIGPNASRETVTLQSAGDQWLGRIHPPTVGEYELNLVASVNRKEIGQSSTRFTVESIDRERRSPLANLKLLRQASAMTAAQGGAYADLSDLDDLLAALRKGDYRRRVTETTRLDIGDEFRWPILAIICGLLAVEWLIRKSVGLV